MNEDMTLLPVSANPLPRWPELEIHTQGHGIMRSAGPALIAATNDVEAIAGWLTQLVQLQRSPATFRSYAGEIRRFLVWCSDRGLGYSDATPEDYNAYFAWLQSPVGRRDPLRPQDRLQSMRRKALSPTSAELAMTILGACGQYLAQRGYLRQNPVFTRQYRSPTARRERSAGRYLDATATQALRDALNLPWKGIHGDEQRLRARVVLALGKGLALRRSEIAATRSNDFMFVVPPGPHREGTWTWTGLRKKRRLGNVPVPTAVMQALGDYRHHIGLPRLPTPDDRTPVVVPLGGEESLTGQSIAMIVADLFQRASELIRESPTMTADQYAAVDRLQRGTTHWLRHTRLSELLMVATLPQVSAFAGHAGPDVTAKVYAHLTTDLSNIPGLDDDPS